MSECFITSTGECNINWIVYLSVRLSSCISLSSSFASQPTLVGVKFACPVLPGQSASGFLLDHCQGFSRIKPKFEGSSWFFY